jgi:hypothetical protein
MSALSGLQGAQHTWGTRHLHGGTWAADRGTLGSLNYLLKVSGTAPTTHLGSEYGIMHHMGLADIREGSRGLHGGT